jgi:hypothetical protein
MKIFTDKLSPVGDDDELQKRIADNPDYDPVFIRVNCGSDLIKTRKWLEGLWNVYEPYAEPDFLQKLRKPDGKNGGFHAFSWQMYLASVLIGKGYKPEENSGSGPDIQVVLDGKNVWIEAVVTTPGDDINAAGRQGSGDIYENIDPRIARVTNAFTEKYKKYEKYLEEGVCADDDVCVIAINGSGTETMHAGYAIEAAMYARGNYQASLNSEGLGYELREKFFIKKDGRDVVIPANYFCDEKYDKISSVIYCQRDIINANNFGRVPEKELFFAINSYAKNKVDDFSIGNVIRRSGDGTIMREML